MKRIALLTGLMVLVTGSAFGEPSATRGSEGALVQQGRDGGSTPPGGLRPGPPPEAYTACEGKREGSTEQFTGRDGETISGTCRMAEGKLVLRPDRPGGNNRDERRGPPPEAYSACEGKSAGSISQFVNPRGDTVKGTCEEEDGKMVLRPDDRRGSRPSQANDTAGMGRGAR